MLPRTSFLLYKKDLFRDKEFLLQQEKEVNKNPELAAKKKLPITPVAIKLISIFSDKIIGDTIEKVQEGLDTF